MPKTDLLDAVDRLYAAALEPELWPDALTSWGQAVGGVGTGMLLVASTSAPVPVISPGLREAAEDYERGWHFDLATAAARERGITAGVWTQLAPGFFVASFGHHGPTGACPRRRPSPRSAEEPRAYR